MANLGTVNETFKVKWYLSLNTNITANDILMGSKQVALDKETFTTVRDEALAIPPGVALNTEYYLGWIVDADNAFAENYGSNNATFAKRKVKVKAQCP